MSPPGGPAASEPLPARERRTAHDLLQRLRDELLAVLVPPTCPACRAPLGDAAAVLCAGCRRALPWLAGPRCPRCALPRPCGRRCPAWGAPYAAAWAPLAYEGPARALVAALKFGGALPVADLMAAQLAAAAPPGLLDGAALVPVPSHPARRRARGYDQAALIAHALARRAGLPLAPCLRREGAPVRQLGAVRADRLAPGRLAIAVAAPVVPARVVLLDDVHTTGATFAACARALRVAGSERVVAVSYSRTLRH